MAKKSAQKKPPKIADRLDTIERLVRSGFRHVDQRFEQVDQRFDGIDKRLDRAEQRMDILEFGQRELKSDFDAKFAILDERINVLTNHVDGFMKLHETLDIEFKVLKEQMNRVEARLDRLEAERTT